MTQVGSNLVKLIFSIKKLISANCNFKFNIDLRGGIAAFLALDEKIGNIIKKDEIHSFFRSKVTFNWFIIKLFVILLIFNGISDIIQRKMIQFSVYRTFLTWFQFCSHFFEKSGNYGVEYRIFWSLNSSFYDQNSILRHWLCVAESQSPHVANSRRIQPWWAWSGFSPRLIRPKNRQNTFEFDLNSI